MNRRAQRLVLSIAWLFITLDFIELLPIAKIASYLGKTFLGNNRTVFGWIFFIIILAVLLLLVWGGMVFLHNWMNNREFKLKQGQWEWIFFSLTGLSAILFIVFLPYSLLKNMWRWELYLRIAALAIVFFYLFPFLLKLLRKEEDSKLSFKEIFYHLILGVGWGIATVFSFILFFSVIWTGKGDSGSLRAFIYGALTGNESSRVLYIYGIIFLFSLTLFIASSKISSVFKKEIKLFFSTPIAYAIIVLFTLLTGVFFHSAFERYKIFASMPPQYFQFYIRQYNISLHPNDIIFQQLFYIYGVILLFVAPIVTMRLIAEEKKSRTYELLMTTPITSFEIVIGKFFAALFQLTFIVSLTFLYPLSWGIMKGGTIEWAPIFTGYLGIVLLLGVFASIGLYFSSLSEEQIVAAALTFGVLMLLWVVQMLTSVVPVGWPRELVKHLAIFTHLQGFAQGVIKSTDIIYYLSFTFFALFTAHRSVESQRWK